MTHSVMIHSFIRPDTFLKKAGLCLGASLLLAASAWVSVPLYPVSFSLQTLAVLLVGVVLGSRLGVCAVMLYLFEGLAGLPVFAGGSGGLAALLSPTFGYKIGFAASAFVAGYAAEHGKDRGFFSALPWLALAHQLSFVGGLLWLSAFMSFKEAFAVGYLPFMGLDVVKFSLAAAICAALWKVPALKGK